MDNDEYIIVDLCHPTPDQIQGVMDGRWESFMDRIRGDQALRIYMAEGQSGRGGCNGERDFDSIESLKAFAYEVINNPKVIAAFGHIPRPRVMELTPETYKLIQLPNDPPNALDGAVTNLGENIMLFARKDSWLKFVVLHELSHLFSGPHHGHDARFAEITLALSRIILGDDPADRLKASYDRFGVDYSPNRARSY